MTDLLLLVVIIVVPAGLVVGLLSLLTMGLEAVADVEESGLLRPAAPRGGRSQPAPGSSSSAVAADGSLTTGPAARISSVTPSA